MFKGRTVAVVMPAHNEEALILASIADVPEYVDFLVVVDDASTDFTRELLESVTDSRVRIVALPINLGVGGAIVEGHKVALREKVDLVAVMAGDGQMDPEQLANLLCPLVEDDFDYAKGNRFFAPGSYSGMPRVRIFGNIVLSLLNKFSSGYYNIFDSQNGFTAIRRQTLLELPLDNLEQGYSFENDMLIHLNMLRARVVDVAIPARYGSEQSGIRLGRVGVEILRTMSRGFLQRVWYKYFYWSFGLLALSVVNAVIACTALVLITLFSLPTVIGPETLGGGTVTLVLALFIVGLLSSMAAIALDLADCPGKAAKVTLVPITARNEETS